MKSGQLKHSCAPGSYDEKNQTCFRTDQLIELVAAYNRYIAKQKLGIDSDSLKNPELNRILKENKSDIGFIPIKDNKEYLLKELRKKFDDICGNDQLCWLKQEFMNEIVGEISDNSFRPVGPKAATEWLSTLDINAILKQYEKIYPKFHFYGAVPLDCNELSYCKLYNLDFEKEESEGIEKIGVIFNHDRHNRSGSHWVAVYIDLPENEFNYCDSAGGLPFDNMLDLINDFKNYCYRKGKEATYYHNTKKYQTDNSECGVYSCNFIIRRLAGESFDEVIKNPLKFKEINSCRNTYFLNKPSSYQPHAKCDPRINY